MEVFWYVLKQNHVGFLADEHIYNLLVRKKSKFDENLFWILRNEPVSENGLLFRQKYAFNSYH
jgi:hypothetical protein